MDTRPSTPDAAEKQVPVINRRRVGVFILAGFIGLELGILGGIVAGFIALLIGRAQYPSLELGLLALLLGPLIMFPIAGLCTGLVTATQRSVERGSVVGAVIFGGSQLVLSIPSITELWMVVAPVVVVAAVIGASIGAGSAAVSRGLSAHNNVPLDAGKRVSPVSVIVLAEPGHLVPKCAHRLTAVSRGEQQEEQKEKQK